MCLIVYRKSGGTITRKQLKKGWDNNPHGGGIMYAQDGKIIIEKETKSFKKFYEMFQFHNTDQPMVIHFRYGNKGGQTKANVHPHVVNEDLAFVHNGTVHEMPYHKSKSDTVLFKEKILANLPNEWEKSKGIRQMMKGYIGNSKLVFLNSEGKVFFVNGNLGHWSDDKLTWYSNDSYKATKSRSYVTGEYTPRKKYKPLTTPTTSSARIDRWRENYSTAIEDKTPTCTTCDLELLPDEDTQCLNCTLQASGYAYGSSLLDREDY